MTSEVPLSVQIEQWRAKLREGSLTQDEMREIVRVLRAGRMTASTATKSTRAKKSTDPIDAEALLKDLEGL